jgi:1,4-alpha-glucan branching enzyme
VKQEQNNMTNQTGMQSKSESITKDLNIETSAERYEDKNFVDTSKPVWNYSILYDDDISTFQQGTHYSLYKKFGSKLLKVLDKEGYYFCVWAPNATKVSVIGNFNDWNPETHQLQPRWDKIVVREGFIPDIKKGEV